MAMEVMFHREPDDGCEGLILTIRTGIKGWMHEGSFRQFPILGVDWVVRRRFVCGGIHPSWFGGEIFVGDIFRR